MADPVLASLLLLATLLPCPLEAGWSKQLEVQLPEHSGGYSAIGYQQSAHRLWLLSDLPEGNLSAWTVPTPTTAPRLLQSLPLQVPPQITQQLDGEALVLDGDQLWVASEGGRSSERPAQLLRFSRSPAALLQAIPLPAAWQPSAEQGLESNAGPESLARLSRSPHPLELLMAAERPLRQGPPDQVPLLPWHWPNGGDPRRAAPQAEAQGGKVAMIYLESPANPTNALVDVEAVKAVRDRHFDPDRCPIAIDNTFLGPLWSRPLDHGADLVVYSLTKYVGGHSNLVAGSIAGAKRWMDPVRALRNTMGGIADPNTAWMLMRSLETVELRMQRAGENAAKVCAFLKDHPKVDGLGYLGFIADPRQQRGRGAVEQPEPPLPGCKRGRAVDDDRAEGRTRR